MILSTAQRDNLVITKDDVARAIAAVDEVQLEIADGKNLSIRLGMTLEEYGRMLTGESHVPVAIRRFVIKE